MSTSPFLLDSCQAPPCKGPQASKQKDEHRDRYKSNVEVSSIFMILLGTLCLVVELIESIDHRLNPPSGIGYCSGSFFIITGALGIFSTKSHTICTIKSFLIMSSIGILFSLGPILVGAVGVGTDKHRPKMPFIMNTIMLLDGIITGIVMIISATFAHKGLLEKSSSINNEQMSWCPSDSLLPPPFDHQEEPPPYSDDDPLPNQRMIPTPIS